MSGAHSLYTLPAAATKLNHRAIASRIEQLPLGRFHLRFITLISLGGWFDFYDIFMIAYIGAAFESSGFLTIAGFSALASAAFLGMFVGTIVFGMGSTAPRDCVDGRAPDDIQLLALGRTRARATGVGFTYRWSRLSAALSSLVIGRVLVYGVPAVFALICAAMAGVAAVVALFGPRTNRQVLERLSA